MGNKNKTNPQISEFEFISIKNKVKKKKNKTKGFYQNYIELLKKYIR